jgi:dihydrolipoamide dehydrogenase
MPKSLIVMGSGAIGIEFASFYRTMGAEVTVVEVLPQIMPVEDAEISKFARKRFEKQGMKIITRRQGDEGREGRRIPSPHHVEGGRQGVAEDHGRPADFRRRRRQGNVEGLGLEKLGVKLDRGTIVIDGLGRTNVAGVYAIGDVAGPPMLAHKAEHEGVICVERSRACTRTRWTRR